MDVKETGDGLRAIKQAIAFFNANHVMVGIPDGGGSSANGMSNVALAFIHSNGSPKHNIPARPFLEPAIEQAAGQIAELMKVAAIQAIEGDTGAAMKKLDDAGTAGENAAKSFFKSGRLAANAEITIHGGWMKNKVSGKTFYVKGKKSAGPLIDTGNLRGSITHVIEKR